MEKPSHAVCLLHFTSGLTIAVSPTHSFAAVVAGVSTAPPSVATGGAGGCATATTPSSGNFTCGGTAGDPHATPPLAPPSAPPGGTEKVGAPSPSEH